MIRNPSAAAASETGGVKLATGSYVGTGTYGNDNPCKLTFDFTPQIVVISKANGRGAFLVLFRLIPYYPMMGSNTYAVGVSWGDDYVEWQSTSAVEDQLNVSGTTYYYFAIG